jgi:hypothetical protein
MLSTQKSVVERYEVPHFTTFATSGEVTKWALNASAEEIQQEINRMNAWSDDFPRYKQLKLVIEEAAFIKNH